MRVTNEQKERRFQNKKREKQRRSDKSIELIIKELNHAMAAMKRNLVFSLGVEEEIRLVYMIDAERNTVVKKIPAVQLQQADRMGDLLGVMIDKDG